MPFRSQAQRRFMYAKHPEIAARWSREYPDQGKLPEHARELVVKQLVKRRIARRG